MANIDPNQLTNQLWEIQEYKFWKGYGTTEWRPINIISRNYQDMHETMQLMERNSPDKVLRVTLSNTELKNG